MKYDGWLGCQIRYCERVPAAIRKEIAEPVGQDQKTEGQLCPPGCQDAELSPCSVPLPFLPHLLWGQQNKTCQGGKYFCKELYVCCNGVA